MQPRNRRPALVLGAILLLAILLRVVNLNNRTLWYDEAFAVLFAQTGWDTMLEGTVSPDNGAAADVHPLLYYQTLNTWMRLFGTGAWAVRLLSVIFGVITVALIYGLTADWFGQRVGQVAALIVAIAPFHVQYSQETRMYALLALALTATTWAYWRAWQRGGPSRWIVFGILAGVSMHVQQLAAFTLLAIGLLPVLARDRARLLRTALAAGLALVIYLPWLVYLPDQLGKLRQYWIERPHILHLWLTLRTFVSVNLDFSTGWWLPTFLLAAVLTVLLFYRAIPALRRLPAASPERQALGWALWLAFAPMILMWIGSYLFQPMFLPRALLPSAVMFYVALAWLFARGGMPRAVVALVAASWGIVIVFGLVTHYRWDTFPNPPFDRAAAFLADAIQPGDRIVHGNKITALPMIYYAPDLPQQYVRDIPGSGSDTLAGPTQDALGLPAAACPAAAAGGAPRVWYVAFEQFAEEMRDLAADDPTTADYDALLWLQAHYQASAYRSFNDLDVVLFTDPDPAALDARCAPGDGADTAE